MAGTTSAIKPPAKAGGFRLRRRKRVLVADVIGAKGQDRANTNVLIDAHRLAGLVVDEVDLRHANNILGFKLTDNTGSHHLP